MHGRPRKSSGDGEKDVAEAVRLQSLQTQFFKNHHDKIYSKEALEISASLAEINPEIYTVWNYRKMAVKNMLESEADGDAIREILNGELRLVERALKRNFKSYGAWYHRKWVINMGYLDSSLDREFQLLDQFLKADGRNFHGWNYRRFVAALKKVPDEEELKFTTKKINENFSNYSAWHNRSVLLSNLLKNKFEEINSKQVLTEEYELVQQALFTDSDDQSGWFYHLWLLGQTVSQNGPRLMATWPSNGSDLAIQLQEQSHIHVTFDNPFGTDQFVFSEGIPLVLHFSEPVKGVNSSTITINSLLAESELLLWKPLSAYGLEAKTWVAILRLPPDFNTNTTYTVEVNVDSLGIISSNGCNLASPMVLNFSLDVQLATANDIVQELETVKLAWEGEIFSPVDIGQDKFPTLSQFCQDIHNPKRSWHNETLESEIKVFRELLEIEMDSKWAKLTLARLLMAQDTLSSGSILGNTRMNTDEVLQLFNELIDIDPSHANYYKDQSSLILFNQVTGSKGKLQDYIWESVSIDFISHRQQNIWLRLNGLSLSRIGCMERLLWLQNLDISHNRLRSIDGLEALQLLSCLNLSYNLLPNFTALSPLRLIMTLTALNIAYNEIGSHSVDTTRYSFPSVLNNSSASTKEFSGVMEQDNLECSWEITLMFKGLHLRQLDTAGNPAIDENCKILLKKILPTLKWLDGTRVI